MSRLFFDVTDQGKSVLRSLPQGGVISIGSAESSQLRLSSPAIAPEHARFDVGTRELVAVAGGVEVDSKPLAVDARVVLEPGSHVRVAESSLHLVIWRPEVARRISSHLYFEERGAEECLRCGRKKTTFSVVSVAAPQSEDSPELESAIASTVRLTDVLAGYSPGTYELLLFELTARDAENVAARIARVVERLSLKCKVGVAHYPADGQTIDALSRSCHAKTLGLASDSSSEGAALPSSDAHDEFLRRLAQSELPVLILGETGSGKEVMASRIHSLSSRAQRPYVRFNCAAFTESLFESELFGHERGAFTGAQGTKQGLLEAANGGTVFLDEIGDMPLAMQAKLLRALEQREVLRVGAVKPTPIDVRFIAATNRDLQAEVAKGAFRSDLYYRLDGATVLVPPLRNRRAEFPHIVRRLLADIAERSKLPEVPQVSPGAMEMLLAYRWPGNVRELRNVLERAVLAAGGATVHQSHLPAGKLGSRFVDVDPARFSADTATTSTELEDGGRAPRRRGLGLVFPGAEQQRLADQERAIIEQTLAQCGGNQSEAARRLRISRQALIKRIKQYGLRRPRSGTDRGGEP